MMFSELLKKFKTAIGIVTDEIVVNNDTPKVFYHFSGKSVAESLVFVRDEDETEGSKFEFGPRTGSGIELCFTVKTKQ